MATTTRATMTAAELFDLSDDGMRHELIQGRLTTMTPAGYEHGKATMAISRVLANFIAEHDLGESSGAETGFVISRNPDSVRVPDFAFVSKGRIDTATADQGFFPGPPDLAVAL